MFWKSNSIATPRRPPCWIIHCCYQIMSRERKLVQWLVNSLFLSRLSKLIMIPDWYTQFLKFFNYLAWQRLNRDVSSQSKIASEHVTKAASSELVVLPWHWNWDRQLHEKVTNRQTLLSMLKLETQLRNFAKKRAFVAQDVMSVPPTVILLRSNAPILGWYWSGRWFQSYLECH